MSIDEKLYGVDLFGESMRPPVTSPVAEKFLVPPFTVLNAREGNWQERKRAWAAMGIQGEIGRDAESYNTGAPGDLSRQMRSEIGRRGITEALPESSKDDFTRLSVDCRNDLGTKGGVSIFDPVVCELAYRWFTGEGAQIIDPFAGGSVRGIVASCLGRKYWGCDLRSEQIDANRVQCEALCNDPLPVWVCGDSLSHLDDAPPADFVFSCPPYGNLEEYSQDPVDLSFMDHSEFLVAYRDIIAKACAKLRQDRFACFVVGDFRDKRGNYRNFVSDTIKAFLDAGLQLYNEAILVTSVGSACMRVTKQFEASRKFAKTHQNVLVFVKGDPKKATLTITK